MKNIKLRKLLGGISASVLAGGSVLAVTACNNPKKDEALNTQITKFIEADGTILFTANENGVVNVISKIEKLIPKLKNSVKLDLDGTATEAIVIKKEGAKDKVTTGKLEKAKYNFEIKTKENKKAEAKHVIKGSFDVSLEAKATINKDFLDKFNIEYIDTTLKGSFSENEDIKSNVTSAIDAAISFQWENKTGIEIVSGADIKAKAASKDKHEVEFSLKNGSTNESKKFKTNFKYEIKAPVADTKVEISDKEIAIAGVTDVTVDDGGFKVLASELKNALEAKIITAINGVDGITGVTNSDFDLEFKIGTNVINETKTVVLNQSETNVEVTIKSKDSSKKIKGTKTITVKCKRT